MASDTHSLHCMSPRRLVTADVDEVTRRLLEMKLATSGQGVDVMALIQEQPALLLERSGQADAGVRVLRWHYYRNLLCTTGIAGGGGGVAARRGLRRDGRLGPAAHAAQGVCRTAQRRARRCP